MSMKGLLVLALSLSTLALPAVAAPKDNGNSLESVIRKVQEQQKSTNTLQADFRQEKTLALLAKPEVSTGQFVFSKPNQVLWSYNAPKRVQMVITAGTLTTYYPDLNKVERLDVQKYQDRIFKYMGASGAIDELAKYFDFTFTNTPAATFYTLDLTPKNATVAKRVKHIRIWIDKSSYLTTKFEYTEADGDLTRYEFTNLRVNQPVPASKFALALPPNVKIEQMKLQ
jgi:outer membrane lipoprotein-sorting protein